MTRCVIPIAVACVVLLLLPGCPGSSLAGLWLMTLSNANTTFGLQLNSDGTATSFNAPSSLIGEFRWELDGTEFFLYHSVSTVRRVYGGRVTNNSFISGAWVEWDGPSLGDSSTWTAIKN